MSQMIKLDITQDCYEGLRCSVCTDYLSFTPLRFLPDGSALCGRCSPPNEVVPYRVFIVEKLLGNVTFPCRYKQYGCTANVQFHKVLNHEDGCSYLPFPCASLPLTSCSWKGSASQVTSHFAEEHSNFVQQKAKIKLRIDQDKEGVMLVKEDSGSFIVKYAFDSTIFSFRYQIRLFMVGVVSQDCKLQLSNDIDPNYSVTLTAEGLACHADLCNDNLLNVDLKYILAVLNNPENVTVVFHVKLPITPTYSSGNIEVDYELLKSKRCARCHYFLVPPLFELKNKIICGDCSHVKGCKRATNKHLEHLENRLIFKDFPCKWRDCDFIGKGDIIGRHHTECHFRLYRCPISSDIFCKDFIKRSVLLEHMKSRHSYYCYFTKKYVHTFALTSFESKKLYTFVDNEIIVIDVGYFNRTENDIKFIFKVLNANSTRNMVVIVYLSHEHCKSKSKNFSFSSNVTINFCDLPECFTIYDKISATVKIKK